MASLYQIQQRARQRRQMTPLTDVEHAWREALQTMVREVTTAKEIKNRMGKKSFRALKRFNTALRSGQEALAEHEAVNLGVKLATIEAMKALLHG